MIITKILLVITIVLLSLFLLLLLKQLRNLKKGNRKVAQELAATHYEQLPDFGEVENFSLLPLVDFETNNKNLKTEPGVSYLIKADDTTILMDVGFNRRKEHPSPLLHNLQTLGISTQSLDAIVISHMHLDHLGGLKEQRKNIFSLSRGDVRLPEIPVYAPDTIAPSPWNPGPVPVVISGPKVLKKGVATIGVIPRNLFLAGHTREHCLAVKVSGKGIVLIIGCGHPTIEQIIVRAQQLFAEPIYGIIGGLHFPVHGGRIMA